jgi:methyltransferase (TIGR00027 family)
MRDDRARELLPGWLRYPLRALEVEPRLLPLARVASLGLLDHVSLRTAAIDDELRTALARGARQLVLLGAGLDARAYRLHDLNDVDAFEIDHPSTQAAKRSRLEGTEPVARSVTFVGVDFERDSLDERLAASGHDAGRPTAWIWEGVTPYLHVEAIDATLDVIAARSAPSSTLLVTYLTPALVEVDIPFNLVPRPILRASFTALGEPIESAFEPEELRAKLAIKGFELRSDTGRFLVGEPPKIVVTERLAVAATPSLQP